MERCSDKASGGKQAGNETHINGSVLKRKKAPWLGQDAFLIRFCCKRLVPLGLALVANVATLGNAGALAGTAT